MLLLVFKESLVSPDHFGVFLKALPDSRAETNQDFNPISRQE